MKYYGLPCPVCGIVMNESDDIVVCPECATPHHRECWFKNGRCINEELHSETFVWSPDSAPSESEPAETKPQETEPATSPVSDSSDGSIVCHICGSENPDDAVHCGSCGALLGKTDETEQVECAFCGAKNPKGALRCTSCGNFLSPSTGKNPFMNGLDENEKIGDHSVADYALYTQISTKQYVAKFRKLSNKRVSFNWAAFLLGPQWFLFRKMYKVGILLMVSVVAVAMMCTPLQLRINKASLEYLEQQGVDLNDPESTPYYAPPITEEDQQKALDNLVALGIKTVVPLAILFHIALAERLLFGFLADRLYYKKVNADLKIIDETVDDENLRKMMIVRRGSVSFLAFFAGRLGHEVLVQIFVFAADKLSAII